MIFNPAVCIASISLPVIDLIISNVGDLDLFFKLTEKTQSRSSSSPYSAPTDVLLSYSYPTSKMMALSYSLWYMYQYNSRSNWKMGDLDIFSKVSDANRRKLCQHHISYFYIVYLLYCIFHIHTMQTLYKSMSSLKVGELDLFFKVTEIDKGKSLSS